jgi:hypothetical protein
MADPIKRRTLPDGRLIPPGLELTPQLPFDEPTEIDQLPVRLMDMSTMGIHPNASTETQNKAGLKAFQAKVKSPDRPLFPTFERTPYEQYNEALAKDNVLPSSRPTYLDDVFAQMLDDAYKKSKGKSGAYENALPAKRLEKYVKTHPRPLLSPDPIEESEDKISFWNSLKRSLGGN